MDKHISRIGTFITTIRRTGSVLQRVFGAVSDRRALPSTSEKPVGWLMRELCRNKTSEPLADDAPSRIVAAVLRHRFASRTTAPQRGFTALTYPREAPAVPWALEAAALAHVSGALGCGRAVREADPTNTELEFGVMDRLAEELHLPPHVRWGIGGPGGGVQLPSYSEALLVALTAARRTLRREHLAASVQAFRKPGVDSRLYVVYCHPHQRAYVERVCRVAGIETIRSPVAFELRAFESDYSDLGQRIEEDIALGHRPLMIIGSYGTSGTAAMDNFEALAQLSQRHRIWLHLDGGRAAEYGLLSDDLGQCARQAHSIATDMSGCGLASAGSAQLWMADRRFFAAAIHNVQSENYYATFAAQEESEGSVSSADRISSSLPERERLGIDIAGMPMTSSIHLALGLERVEEVRAGLEADRRWTLALAERLPAYGFRVVGSPRAGLVCFTLGMTSGLVPAFLHAARNDVGVLLTVWEQSIAEPVLQCNVTEAARSRHSDPHQFAALLGGVRDKVVSGTTGYTTNST